MQIKNESGNPNELGTNSKNPLVISDLPSIEKIESILDSITKDLYGKLMMSNFLFR